MAKAKTAVVAAEADQSAPPTPQTPETVAEAPKELDVSRPYSLEDLHRSKKVHSPFTFLG